MVADRNILGQEFRAGNSQGDCSDFLGGSRSEDHTLFAERPSESGRSIRAFRLRDKLIDVATAGEDRAKKSASL